ncbi:MAG: tRNA (adenosine(37)-N6)-threonylcarbamoyltransferase complex dimerization subunit type 1 TsaB, partial [Treponema sp.]|nr:tRNA (adenosine(37)-N6)-threonylcarbamoyltransferase complex dimerization subunit type 1 TsaB [Treponema sp.]
VALAAETGVWYTEIDAGTRHSELLMECVDGLCTSASLKGRDINLAACMQGPGSFTGLRIGFATAKGICLALGIPLVAVPTLDCLARHLEQWPGIVLPVLDAKKGCFFSALYRNGERLTACMDAAPETLAAEIAKYRLFPGEKVILTGSGAGLVFPLLQKSIPPETLRIDPESRRGRARELLDFVKSGKFSTVNDINSGPIYLRKSDAELNWSQ